MPLCLSPQCIVDGRQANSSRDSRLVADKKTANEGRNVYSRGRSKEVTLHLVHRRYQVLAWLGGPAEREHGARQHGNNGQDGQDK